MNSVTFLNVIRTKIDTGFDLLIDRTQLIRIINKNFGTLKTTIYFNSTQKGSVIIFEPRQYQQPFIQYTKPTKMK